MCVCVCVCACVRACVCVWMSACLCACLCTYVCRVSFRKMGKGGAKQYLQNKWGGGGGAKGVHAIVRLLGGLGT